MIFLQRQRVADDFFQALVKNLRQPFAVFLHGQLAVVRIDIPRQAALFPAGRSGMSRIIVGAWRDGSAGPMQVVSGPIGR